MRSLEEMAGYTASGLVLVPNVQNMGPLIINPSSGPRAMLMCRSVLIVLLLLSGALVPAEAQGDVPQKLVEYVRDAQKAGIKSTAIRQSAVTAGWPEADVEAALNAVAAAKPSSNSAPPVQPEKDLTAAAPRKPATSPAAAPVEAPEGTKTGNSATGPAAVLAGDAVGASAKAVAAAMKGEDYLIGEGDVLQVSVWGEPAASVQSATVRPDGKISMPLIKEVAVAGLTPAQVEATIQEQLSKIIRAPDVTVIVAQINSKKIFLTGAVKREGPLKYTYRMTVLQAISEAGGLTDYAKRKNIYVLHNENGRQYRLPFNYISVLKGESMEQNIMLSPGDTIVVP